MNDKYEVDGIIYFNTPFKVDYLSWLSQHLDCDSIITKESSHCDIVCILCYASTCDYNKDLRLIRNKKYPNDIILQGLSSEEVNCID